MAECCYCSGFFYFTHFTLANFRSCSCACWVLCSLPFSPCMAFCRNRFRFYQIVTVFTTVFSCSRFCTCRLFGNLNILFTVIITGCRCLFYLDKSAQHDDAQQQTKHASDPLELHFLLLSLNSFNRIYFQFRLNHSVEYIYFFNKKRPQ